MARKRLPVQQDLLSAVWTITSVRENVERLLEHVIQLQSEAIALASAYGVRQSELATLTGQSRQRIGQRAEEVDVSELQLSVLRRQIDEVEGWPGDVMSALLTLAHPGDRDDPDRRERQRQQTAVVYGQEEADKRHNARSDFLASLPERPEDRAAIAERTEQARRRVSGAG